MPRYCMPHMGASRTLGGRAREGATKNGEEGGGKAHGKSYMKIVNGKQKGERKRPLSPSSPSPFLPPYYPLSPISPFPLKERVQDGLASLALSFIAIHDSARYARACPLFHWRYIMSMHIAQASPLEEGKTQSKAKKACRRPADVSQCPRFPLGRSARARARSEAPIPHAYIPARGGWKGETSPSQHAYGGGGRPPRRPRGGPRLAGMPLETRRRPVWRDYASGR